MIREIPRGKAPPGMAYWACQVEHCRFGCLTKNGEPTTHRCPYMGGITKIGWTVYGPTLLEQMWTEMDRSLDEFFKMKEEGSSQLEFQKGRLRGLAFTLSLFMVPHFQTEDEIAKEAIKRRKARVAGETYDSPGLGSRIYEPPPGDNKYAVQSQNGSGSAGGHSQAKSNTRGLPVEEIRQKLELGFPADILAVKYGTTAGKILELRSS